MSFFLQYPCFFIKIEQIECFFMKFSILGKQTTIELDDSVLNIEDSFNDDDEMDPDWQKTPLVRAKRKTTVSLPLLNTILNSHILIILFQFKAIGFDD